MRREEDDRQERIRRDGRGDEGWEGIEKGGDTEEGVLTLRGREGGRNPSGVLLASNAKTTISLGPTGAYCLGWANIHPVLTLQVAS